MIIDILSTPKFQFFGLKYFIGNQKSTPASPFWGRQSALFRFLAIPRVLCPRLYFVILSWTTFVILAGFVQYLLLSI